MAWKKITLHNEDIRQGIDDRIQEAFVEHIAEAGWPEGAIMYVTINIVAQECHYFFPPAAVVAAKYLLELYGAVECPEPVLEQLTVLVKRTSGGRRDL